MCVTSLVVKVQPGADTTAAMSPPGFCISAKAARTVFDTKPAAARTSSSGDGDAGGLDVDKLSVALSPL